MTCDDMDYVKPETKPYSPSDCLNKRVIPGFVLEAFNELLTKRFMRGGLVVISRDEIIPIILGKAPENLDLKREMLFINGWLNIQAAYENNGWKVEWDGKDYTGDGSNSWTFTPKREK